MPNGMTWCRASGLRCLLARGVPRLHQVLWPCRAKYWLRARSPKQAGPGDRGTWISSKAASGTSDSSGGLSTGGTLSVAAASCLPNKSALGICYSHQDQSTFLTTCLPWSSASLFSYHGSFHQSIATTIPD
jgi:hypothetical protein